MKCSSTHPQAIRAAAEFPEKLKAVHGEKIRIRESAVYQGCMKPLDVACSVCGHGWSPIASNLLSGKGCPQCAIKLKAEITVASAGKLRAPRATPQEKKRAAELRASGLTLDAIAQQLFDEGLSPQLRGISTINRWLDPEYAERQRQRNAKWNETNRERKRAICRRWSTEFDHGRAANRTAKSRRRKRKKGEWEVLENGMVVTLLDPPLTGRDKELTDQYHADCARLTEETGIQHHVDHIKPYCLGGPNIWYNLQILTAEENLQKGGKYRPEDQALYAMRVAALF